MRIIILVTALVLAPVFWVSAQSNDLQTAYDKLVDIKANEELSQGEKDKQELAAAIAALKEVIEFTIAETNSLTDKLESLGNLPAKYAELQRQYLATLQEFLKYQKNYLNKLDDPNLNLDEVKKLATDFKAWREDIYDQQIQEILSFILVSRSFNILIITYKRYEKIVSDLQLLKNSKIIKTEVLWPVLNQAAGLLNEATQIQQQAFQSLATSTPSVDPNKLIGLVIEKVKAIYGKFLEMGVLVKKMVSR